MGDEAISTDRRRSDPRVLRSARNNLDCLAFVGKAQIAGDHEEPADAGERDNDLLDHAIGEIFLRLDELGFIWDPASRNPNSPTS